MLACKDFVVALWESCTHSIILL